MDNFSRCFAFTFGAEGGFSNIPSDQGNWTGGAVGHGVLRGTKYGISAASYPGLDIENLSEADAEEIYRRDFYDALKGDELPLPVALVVFDGAVNAGLCRAIGWLQQAIGRPADGVMGPETLKMVNATNAVGVAGEMLAWRIDFYSRLAEWANFGLGWTRRVISLAGEMVRE